MIHVVIWLIILAIYYFYHVYKGSVEGAEEERFFHELMNNNNKTKLDMEQKNLNGSNNLNEATSLLVLTTLRNIGCNPEIEEYGLSDVITFTYQGQPFFIVCNGGSHYITVKNSCWYQMSIYRDVEEITKMYRIINLSNQCSNCTLFYTIDKEAAMISVHCRKQILFNKEIQQLNSYLRRALGDIFVAQRIFREQMGKCKVTENFAIAITVIIAEGVVIYFQQQRMNGIELLERENEEMRNYIDDLHSKLDLERMGLRNDTRGGDFCPACYSKDVAEVRYGYYDSDRNMWKEELQSGKVILGGCLIGEDSKRFYCNECGYEWGSVK